MKKLIMLSVVGILTMSSFNIKTEKTRTLWKYTYTCSDGTGGWFLTYDREGAWDFANRLCR